MGSDVAVDQKHTPDTPVAPKAASGPSPASPGALGTTTSLGASQVQAKAEVGPASDPAEAAADAEADRVLRMPARGAPGAGAPAPVAEPPTPAGQPPARGTPAVSDDVQAYLAASRGQGMPLPEKARKDFEQRFQRGFGDVRIHDESAADDAAKSIDALAFTRGNDIYFRAGAFDPESESGKHLLAHELAHVVQQRPGINRRAAPGLGGAVIRRAKNAGGGGAKKKQKGTETTVTRTTDPKGTIDTTAKTLEIDELVMTGWKTRNDFALGAATWRTAKDARTNKQRQMWWDSSILKGQAKTGVENRAKALKLGKEPYRMQAVAKKQASNFPFMGTADDIAGAVLIPPWNSLGNYSRWDVDHKKEWQLGGDDVEDNLWLLEESVNRRVGPTVTQAIYASIDTFLAAVNPQLAKPQTSKGIHAKNWAVTWKALKSDKEGFPHRSKWWKAEDIGADMHMAGLEEFTGKAEFLEGSPTSLAIYNRPGGGQVKHLPITKGATGWQPVTNWDKTRGYHIKEVNWLPNGPSPETGIVGELTGDVFKKGSKGKKKVDHKGGFTPKIHGMRGVTYGGYVDKPGISDLRAKFASPIEFDHLDFDFDRGVVGRGVIRKPELKLLERAQIYITLADGDVGIEAVLPGEALALPGPFKVLGGALVLGTSDEGVTVSGQVDFEIERLATGYLRASAANKVGAPTLALEGELDFDTEMFTKASLGLSYKDGKWGVTGQLAVGKDKITGIRSASVDVAVDDDTVTAAGEFETTLEGIDKGKIGFRYHPATGMEITGAIDLGAGIPGIKGGTLDATVKQGKEGWTLAGGVLLEPDIPGLTGSVTGRYEDGAFLVEAELGYERGLAKGSVRLGLTNQAIGPDGRPQGPPKPDGSVTAYGGGTVTLTITPWLEGTVGLGLKPNGEIEVSGEVALPSSFEVFPEKKVSRQVFSIGIDLPIVGVVVAGQRIGIFATIRGGLDAYAGFGPGQLKDVALRVSYNPDHEDQTTVTGTGSFYVPAGAGLRLSVDGGLGAGIPVVSATAGVSIYGEVGLAGAASAGTTINWTPGAGVVLDARGELSVQPKFKFGVDAFVEVTADVLVTEVDLYSNRWKLSAFEYGSNMTFGLVFPLHYESGQPFDIDFDQIKWNYPQIDALELLSGLMEQLV